MLVDAAGLPRLNAAGPTPSASIVSDPVVVSGAGTVSPFEPVIVYEPGLENGTPVPSKL